MSNLNEAWSLIQADLEHARNVVNLWTRQAAELEKALEQITAVDTSRSALQVEYQGTKGPIAVLNSPVAMKDVSQRRGRKPKNAIAGANPDAAPPSTDIAKKRSSKLAERSSKQAAKSSEGKPGQAAKKAAKKTARGTPVAKYKDPNSDKTWSGLGRPPIWLQGDRAQYEIHKQGNNGPGDIANDADAGATSPSQNSTVA